MNKAFYFCILSLIFINNPCFAQVPAPAHDTVRVIEIINGKSLREKSIDSVSKIETIAGDVLMKEGFTKFSCDSAVIDRKLNTIEAFGNVHINDADSVHTYAQYLKYFGDTRLAHLKKNVKLTDKKGILFTDNLDYDLASGIGNYYDGGKVINGTTVLTSKEGVYYSATKDVYFRNNVDLTDPKYKIKADSLLYNTISQVVTFIGPTYIKSKEANIFTTQGTYDLNKGNAFFGTRSLITDSSRRVYQADRTALDEKAGLAELEGSAVIKDSVNGVIVTANHIFLNNRNNSFLATNKPVMIIERDKDSTYISADTLFSGFTTKINSQPDTVKTVSSKTDSLKTDSLSTIPVSKDSFQLNKMKRAGVILRNNNDISKEYHRDSLQTTPEVKDSLALQKVKKTAVLNENKNDTSKEYYRDSLKTTPVKKDSLALQKVKDSGALIVKKNDAKVPARDSLRAAAILRDSLQPHKGRRNPKEVRNKNDAIDSLKTDTLKIIPLKILPVRSDTGKEDAITKFNETDTLPGRSLKPGNFNPEEIKPSPNDSVRVDTIKGTRIAGLNKGDSSVRYFLAFHHVRIFNDSLQSVCDSLFFSAKDSIFRLFYNPIVWNGQSQITGDTIYMYTKNKKPERLYVFENGMIVNKNEKELYNQIAGKTINAYFKDGVIDYARVRGQKAESIYYVQDKDSAYVGMNRSNGDVIDLFFKEKALNKVKFINDVHGTMYPMRQIPDDQKLLKDFNWQDKRRPKNKLELFE